MPTSNSPYSAFAALLASSGYTISPAELHGLLLGRSCAGAGFEIDSWLVDAAELLGAAPEDTVRQALIGLQEMVNSALSAEAMEVLQDLSAISQVQNALDESDDGENDYMEVMEYLRVAPLLLFSECAKPVVAAAKPSLH